ncbi:5-(carboxyamino)imidazole ribonucleotide synthase [Egicoccus halophilus]|uniref:N5-carboxyaminoimidazole ribonucleotide synthase n=1 Tax=Egicoccus halophilus TaxID=1670830 RepID=A0A8J3A8H6_9ACTN|nr:N5-carboxyaminoimidazole ribonucleotide synthase [Egicoccus halophilus]
MPPTIGVVGGGQLARMLLPSAARLGLPLVFLARPGDAVGAVWPAVLSGEPDADGLRRLAARVDVVTVEHELVDLDTMQTLQDAGTPVRPSAATLAIATDKVRQREVLAAAGVPVAPWTLAGDLDAIGAFGDVHGWPLVLKRPRGGYDGRGVWVVDDLDAARTVLDEVDGDPLLVEPKVTLTGELAVLVARRPGGETVVYDPVETVQVDAMCREVLQPPRVPAAVAARARELAALVADAIGSVGMLSVELFVSGEQVLLNELAARPHNAGHLTIEGTVTSQFENHLRAVADLPLGSPASRGPAVMVNVVGGPVDPQQRLAETLAAEPAVAVHLYGKDHRPGRKLGHVTATGDDLETVRGRALRAADRLTAPAEEASS